MTVAFEKCTNLSGDTAILHGFFGRTGGVSHAPYDSLNCSTASGDVLEDVLENRRIVLRSLGLMPDTLALAKQVHSAKVVTATGPFDEDSRPEADALVTDRPGVSLGVLTADCVPVLFVDSNARIIGACHAGWRGAVDHVVAATIDAMEKLGADRHNIRAAIGPCIHMPDYEVGNEWANALVARNPEYERFIHIPRGGEREHFDLPGFVLARLRDGGIIDPGHVGTSTFASPEKYFSHRQGSPGRQLSVIALTDTGN